MQKKHLMRIVVVTALILLVPLVAMQFTTQVDWDLADFMVAGTLLFGAGLSYTFLASKRNSVGYRIIISVAVALMLFLVWAELAVGVFDTPWAGS